MKTKRGFTFVEIMIAIGVIGILVAIALPAYQSYITRTNINNCFKYITPALMTADNLIQNAGGSADNTVIADSTILGLSSGVISSSACDNISIANQNDSGDIDIIGAKSGNIMRWRRDGSNGSWACSTTAGNDAFIPQLCP